MCTFGFNRLLALCAVWMCFFIFGDSLVLPFDSTKSTNSSKRDDVKETPCTPYSYCEGTRFPPTIVDVGGRTVTCDPVPDPTLCCLISSEPHYACYNIMVDGLFQAFTNDPVYATDFTALCHLMLQKQGVAPGSFTSISKELAGGQVAYRYGEYVKLPTEYNNAEYNIRHLACGIDN